MLALDHRRQDNNHYFNDHLPSPTTQPSHLAFFSRIPYTTATPSPSDFNSSKTPSTYFETSPAFSQPNDQTIDVDADNDQYMSNNFSYSSPAIRLQQSTPTPSFQQQHPQSQSQLPFDTTAYAPVWNPIAANSNMVATHAIQQAQGINRNRSHHRAPSSSSIGSSGSASPFSQSHATYNYVSESSPSINSASKLGPNYTVEQSANGYSNHLPTPTQTPTQDSFMVPSYSGYNQQGGIEAAHLAMNNAIEEDIPGMSNSGRQSLSSIGQEPSTPHTVAEGNDDFKTPHDMRQNFPKLDRTVSDAYQDELYYPSTMAPSSSMSATTSKPSRQYLNVVSPHRQKVAELLQQAQIARSQSPTSVNSRGVSPFRPDSPYVQDGYGMRFGTASQQRQQQKAQAEAAELSQHMAQQHDNQPKTISPKDAVLEYNETEDDAKMPLFPQGESSQFGQQFTGGQQSYQTGGQGFSGLDASRAASWTNPRRQSATQTFSTTPISQPQQNAYNFASPSISGTMSGLPFSTQNYRPTGSAAMTSPLKQEETPDFPAHLTSMDSSASEAPPSSGSTSNHTETQKPTSSLADTGTYTCTYHGCTLRFETPQKLQKHKREGHRNPAVAAASTATTPGVGSGMTSAALMQRNSQAGPHKCERTNPTTGKPCNTIFSRPYDLTRHEDTIHNARKQKVRCALCVEEKTFSRNDALTRHMRVVHPEVDFPGKHRRRGAQD